MNNLNTYFPERFVKSRERFAKLTKLFIDADFKENNSDYSDLRYLIRQPVVDWHRGAEIPEWLRLLEPGGTDTVNEASDNPRFKSWFDWLKEAKKHIVIYPRLEEEVEITASLIEFYNAGRNIFSISPFLATLLKETDVLNVRYQDIKLPYDVIYLHFGPMGDIEFPVSCLEHKHNIENKLQDAEKRFYLDGAFIKVNRGHCLDIRLTFIDTKDDFNSRQSITHDFRFPTANFILEFQDWDKDTNSFKLSANSTFKDATVCFSDLWDPESEPGELEYSKMHSLISEPEKCYESELEEYILFDKSLTLIVNSLCYMNFAKEDLQLRTTNSQATEILDQLRHTKGKQARNRLTEKINKLSYSKIHYIGRNIESEYKITESGIEVEPHWRRGHWRNQPFGIGLSDSKLIWIRPTIVRKDKGGPGFGHIYEL